jgi:hypothetical protein
MRRALITAALGASLLAAAACSADPATEASTQTSASATASPSATAAAGGTATKAQTCADFDKLQLEVKPKLMTGLGTLFASVTDKSKEPQAIQEITGAFTDMGNGLAKIQAEAGDPELKAALGAWVTEIKRAATEMAAAGPDAEKALGVMETLDDTVEEKVTNLCK